MSIQDQISALEKEQQKFSRGSSGWNSLENKIRELKKKRNRKEGRKEEDSDLSSLVAMGILTSGGNEEHQEVHESGGGGSEGDFGDIDVGGD